MQLTIRDNTDLFTNAEIMKSIPKNGNLLKDGDYTCTYLVQGDVCTAQVFKTVAFDLFRGVNAADVPDNMTSAIYTQLSLSDPIKLEATNTTKIKSVLADCASLISELSEDLEVAQIKCHNLKHYTYNSQYRADKARLQLVEQGLVRKDGKGYVFTELGLELRLGTNTRSADSVTQILRYSPNVLKYINSKAPYKTPHSSIKNIKLKAPDGKIHTVNRVPTFSKEHNLIKGKVYLMIKGIVISHRGWQLA